MSTRTQNWSDSKVLRHIEELEATRPYVNTTIVADGERLNKAVKALQSGQSLQEIGLKFGDKLAARAERLSDKLLNKTAYLGRKSAGRCGLIKLVSIVDQTGDPRLVNEVIGFTGPVLTLKGELTVSGYHEWALKNMTTEQAKMMADKYKAKLLSNCMLWVRTDRCAVKQDTGMELYSALIKPVQQGDVELAVDIAKKFLFALENEAVIKEGIEKIGSQMQEMFPILDPVLSHNLDELSKIEEGIESLDEEGEAIVERYTGGREATGSPMTRERFLHQLESCSGMSMDELWNNVLLPLVDHYTSRPYGLSVDMVYLDLTEEQVLKDREDFPYEPTVVQESWYKKVGTRTEELGNDEAGHSLGKQVIETRETHSMRTALDTSNEFMYQGLEEVKEWRKQLVFAIMGMPGGKEYLEQKGYKTITDDGYAIVAQARYLKSCYEEGTEPTDKGLVQYIRKNMPYYAWDHV